MKRNRTTAEKREMSKSKKVESSIAVKVEVEDIPISEPKRLKSVKLEVHDADTSLELGRMPETVGVVSPLPAAKSNTGGKIENSNNQEHPSPLCILNDSDDEFAYALIEWAEQNGF